MDKKFIMCKDELKLKEKRLVRLSGIAYESLSNGPGMRRVFFSQGCVHECIGCFNPSTHSFCGGELKDMDLLIDDIKNNPILKGVTFSGGDPFEQPDEFAYIAKKVKELGLDIWCYTGYTYEYILENICNKQGFYKLLYNIDVLVDGEFDINRKDVRLKFRGSSNQRIIDVKASLSGGKVVVLDFHN
jgi:anaerobic ribonucleoside-triphosphate reductase activating protein